MNFHFNWICIPLSWRASPSYRVNTLGPLCLWQCLRPSFFYGLLYMLAQCHFMFKETFNFKVFTITVTLTHLPSPSSPRLIVSIIQKSLMKPFGSFNNGCKYVWGFASVPYFWLLFHIFGSPRNLWPETWHLRHWFHFWQLRTTILTVTLWPLNKEWWWQHSQFLRCFRIDPS